MKRFLSSQVRSRHKGMIMAFVLLLMPICIILGNVMISNIMAEKRNLRYEKVKGQSFYLAETGLNAAYYAFSASTFTSFTHTKSNTSNNPNDPGTVVSATSVTPPRLTLSTALINKIPFTLASDGWYEYVWDYKKKYASLTNSGQPEKIRFRVTRTYWDPTKTTGRQTGWEIVCVATLGTTVKTHRLSGQLEGISTHAIFDAGNLNEFIRGQNQDVFGKVHANGDIYLKPSGTTLTVETGTSDPSFTTAGRFWYGKDATGRTNMGTVKLGGSKTTIKTWTKNLDSASTNWVSDATSLWGNVVKDKALGATVKGVPPVQSFAPDGFYANTAQTGGLRIYNDKGVTKVGNDGIGGQKVGTGVLKDVVKEISFYNRAEKRTITAVQVDMSKLTASNFPNGLLYSEKPLVLINSEKLPQNTSIVSQSGVYTLGDFNKELASLDDYNRYYGKSGYKADTTYTTKKAAAIMTTDRIWHLSKNFPLSTNTSQGQPSIDDPETYAGDNKHVNRDTANGANSVVEINSLLLDGAPLYDETWNRKVDTDSVTGAQKAVPKWGPTNPDPSNGSTSWDDFLETYGGSRVVKKRGSIVHLQNATMAGPASLTNPTLALADGVTAWYHQTSYDPPYRDYGYDPLLRATPPPFTPYVAARSLWKSY